MFVPYGTDTPIYHWPFATGALMLINIVVFVLQSMHPEAQMDYILVHGEGLQPLQWLTSIFMHGGVVHLIGNLVFLWAFGIIVEGKVGPLIFCLIYIGIGVLECMIEQLLFLPFPDLYAESLGASAAIFGLMMVALVWAPQDNLKILFNPYLFFIYFIEVPIAFFALVYFLLDFTIAYFTGFSFGSSLFHLLGGVIGLGVGVGFIFLHQVDAEGRDLFSMFLELIGKQPIKKKKTRAEERELEDQKQAKREARKQKLVVCQKSLAAHLAAGNAVAAAATFRQIKKLDKNATWDETKLLKLIAAFQSKSQWDGAIEYSQLYLDSFETKKIAVGINLAKIQLLQKESPRRALKTIGLLRDSGGGLKRTAQQEKIISQIKAKANKMVADGAIELD